MKKNKSNKFKNFITRYSAIIFVCLAALIISGTLVFAIRKNAEASVTIPEDNIEATASPEETAEPIEIPKAILSKTSDEALVSTVTAFYEAQEKGDEEAIKNICPEISNHDLIRFIELSPYIEKYDSIEVYTKSDSVEDNVLVFVYYQVQFKDLEVLVPGYQSLFLSLNEDGKYLVRREETYTEDEKAYILEVTSSDEVVDFNNRVTVAFNSCLEDYPEVLNYVYRMNTTVNLTVGEKLALMLKGENPDAPEYTPDPDDPNSDIEEPVDSPEPTEEPEPEIVFMRTTETINVRNSDSQDATKLGSAKAGTSYQVLEVLLNGWTKILFEGQDGYVKTIYLEKTLGVPDYEKTGRAKSTANVNVRMTASQEADRLGVLKKGTEVDLLGSVGEWSRVDYDGQVGYVKNEFLTIIE